jgi:hypothetical protein
MKFGIRGQRSIAMIHADKSASAVVPMAASDSNGPDAGPSDAGSTDVAG